MLLTWAPTVYLYEWVVLLCTADWKMVQQKYGILNYYIKMKQVPIYTDHWWSDDDHKK